jgi:hypothetical protein
MVGDRWQVSGLRKGVSRRMPGTTESSGLVQYRLRSRSRCWRQWLRCGGRTRLFSSVGLLSICKSWNFGRGRLRLCESPAFRATVRYR